MTAVMHILLVILVVGQPSCNRYRSVIVPDGAQINHGESTQLLVHMVTSIAKPCILRTFPQHSIFFQMMFAKLPTCQSCL